MLLPSRPKRYDGESALGYVMRLGQVHGVRATSDILRDLNLKWSDVARGQGLDHIATSTLTDLERLRHDTGLTSPKGVALRGEFLRRKQWSVHKSRRACPYCLEADLEANTQAKPYPWHRTWWDVRAITVCPTHYSLLQTYCSICGDVLDFRFTTIATCKNGHALGGARQLACNEAEGDAYIVGRLGGATRLSNAILDSGSLAEAIEAMDIVGSCALGGHLPLPTSSQQHRVLAAGYDVFAHWPASFDRLLDQLVTKARIGPGQWGAATAYGPLHTRVAEFKDSPITRALKEAVRRHAAIHGISASKPVFGTAMRSKNLLTLTEAASRLRRSTASTHSLVRTRGLLPLKTKRGTPIMLPSAAIDELVAEQANKVTITELARMLKIGRTQARGVAPLITADGTDLTIDAISNFVHVLSDNLPRRFERSETASLPSACRTASCSLHNALKAILNRTITPAGGTITSGLRGIFVRVSDLHALGKTPPAELSINDGARELGIKWQTVRDLIRLKLIKRHSAGIARSEIRRFQQNYVSCADLARLRRLSPRTLMKHLAASCIMPAAAPPSCRQVFYRRSDISDRSA